MFLAVIDVLQVDDGEVIKEFTKCLNQDMLAEWTDVRNSLVPAIPETRAGFDQLIEEFIDFFAPDPDAKQTMITALEQKKRTIFTLILQHN